MTLKVPLQVKKQNYWPETVSIKMNCWLKISKIPSKPGEFYQ